MSFGSLSIAFAKFYIVFLCVGALQLDLGCCHPMTNLPTHNGCDLSEPTAATKDGPGGCSPAICGSNSPYVNTFPINGLNPHGCINADGYAFKPGSFTPDKNSCDFHSLYLDFAKAGSEGKSMPGPLTNGQGWQLVGRDLISRNIICEGSQLAGATFDVASKYGSAVTTLIVSHVGKTSVTYLLPQSPDKVTECKKGCKGDSKCETKCEQPIEQQEERFVYLIANKSNPTRSLCTKYSRHHQPRADGADQTIISPISHVVNQAPLWDVAREELGSYAVIIPGTIYSDTATPLINTGLAQKDNTSWFNIACAGDGLGQSDLSGITPSSEPFLNDYKFAPDNLRRAAIHMFTAQYNDGASGTVGGMPISWKTPDGRASFESELKRDSGKLGPEEATWDELGAITVSHSRLWMKNRVIPFPPDIKAKHPHYTKPLTNEEDFLGMLCEHEGPSKHEGDTAGMFKSRTKILTSYVRGHVDHNSGEEPKSCSPQTKTSLTVTGP